MEVCHHDQIQFNLKGNENIVFSEQPDQKNLVFFQDILTRIARHQLKSDCIDNVSIDLSYRKGYIRTLTHTKRIVYTYNISIREYFLQLDWKILT